MESTIPLSAVRIRDSFWQKTQRLISEVVLPYQWDVLNDRVAGAEPSHCLRNFRIAAEGSAEGHKGMVFQDSDAYKWLEAVAYSLALSPNPGLEAAAEEAVDLICRAQAPDGYLNTYYMIEEPDSRFRNLTEGHELYCAGHLFEAAVAYYEATGRRALLDAALRLADCLARHFLAGCEARGYPGHPEVELALARLYEATGNETCLRLCAYFLDARGRGESWRKTELARGGFRRHWGEALFSAPLTYAQEHAPVREQRKAAGHAVRAMYLYSAMADMARLAGDKALDEACRALFESTVRRQMYVTGGVGSAAAAECFTTDFDLPNDSAYAETCAGVGLMLFARRMWRLTRNPACYDAWEKALYNTVLSGMGRDGRHFFYVNPLAVDPAVIAANPTLKHVLPERPLWFGCACCPTNLARTVLSMGRYLFAREADGLYVLSHLESEATLGELRVSITRRGERHTLALDGPPMDVFLRKPEGSELCCEGGEAAEGYIRLRHPGGRGTYAYGLTPRLRILRADPRIDHAGGKVCVAYGPSVYCLEEKDNGPGLCALALPRDARLQPVAMDWLPEGMPAFRATGARLTGEGWAAAYGETPPGEAPATLTFVPYSHWGNRGRGEMRVWVREGH